MNDLPIPPRDLAHARKIPVALEQVIMRCLEKDPEFRYQSMTELREDLGRATATVETTMGSRLRRRTRQLTPVSPGGRRRLLWTLAGIGMFTLAGIAFWLAAGLSIDDLLYSPRSAGKKQPRQPTSRAADTHHTPPDSTIARVMLRSDPPGAAIYRQVGDALSPPIGYTPTEIRSNEVTLDLIFRLSGYKDSREHVAVVDNTLVHVALEPLSNEERQPETSETSKPRYQRNPRYQRPIGGGVVDLAEKTAEAMAARRRLNESTNKRAPSRRPQHTIRNYSGRDPTAPRLLRRRDKKPRRDISPTETVDPFAGR